MQTNNDKHEVFLSNEGNIHLVEMSLAQKNFVCAPVGGNVIMPWEIMQCAFVSIETHFNALTHMTGKHEKVTLMPKLESSFS